MKKLKKAFTIVELVIVIAVIAILAAVLIPTFVNVVKKANESSDISAVKNMNTYLAIEDATKGDLTIADVYAALGENGIKAEKYTPLYSGRFFFYDQDENRIVYTDEDYNVLYPEGMEKGDHQWYSLNGVILEEEYDSVHSSRQTENGVTWEVFDISTAGQLAKLNNDINDILSNSSTSTLFHAEPVLDTSTIYGLADTHIEINLKADIDLMGAALNINLKNSDLTINGNGHTLSGIVNIRDFAVSNSNTNKVKRGYGSGIAGYVYNNGATTNPSIVFNNLTVTNSYFGSTDFTETNLSGSGVLVGFSGGCDIVVNNVKIDNCSINAEKGAGTVVGYVTNATVTFTGVNTISNIKLQASEEAPQGCVAGVIGRLALRDANAYVEVACESYSGTLDEISVLQLDVDTVSILSTYRTGVWFYADTSAAGDGYSVDEAPVDGTTRYTQSSQSSVAS